MRAALTLGIEEELHVVDLKTRQQLQRTTVETNTPVVTTLDDLRAAVVGLRQRLGSMADDLGLGAAAVGTAPLSSSGDFELTSTTARVGSG